MAFITCPKGHKYNNSKFDQCPYCLKLSKQISQNHIFSEKIDQIKSQMMQDVNQTVALREVVDEGATVGIFAEGGFEPVVGWLVCIAGTSRGRDYRLRQGKNFVGRQTFCDISIPEDIHISEVHFILVYDPESRAYIVVPQNGCFVYLNAKLILEPAELHTDDIIKIGETTLQFVSFGGGNFQW